MDSVPQAPVILITGGGRGVGAATARLAVQVAELFAAIDRTFARRSIMPRPLRRNHSLANITFSPLLFSASIDRYYR